MSFLNRRALTLTEITASLGIVSLVFLILGSAWFFFIKKVIGDQKLEEVKQEMILVISQIESDLSFKTIGSLISGHHGVVVCGSGSSTPCGGNTKLALRTDADDDLTTFDDAWITYSFDSSSSSLLRCEKGKCEVVSNRITEFTVSKEPEGAEEGKYFLIKIKMTVIYDPKAAADPHSNPELSQTFILAAHQVSVR